MGLDPDEQREGAPSLAVFRLVGAESRGVSREGISTEGNARPPPVARDAPVAGDVPVAGAASPSSPAVSAQALRAAVDGAADCLVLVSRDGTVAYVNATGRALLDLDDAVLGTPWHEIWPEEARGDHIAALQAASEGRRTTFEVARPAASGVPVWWDVAAAPVSGADAGEGAIMVLRDATERVQRENRLRLAEMEARAEAEVARAEEERAALRQQGVDADADEVLMREADHRMKNSLALVGALLTLEGRKVTDERARETLKAAAARVATIASVHEQLYRGTRRGALELAPYLERLAVDLVNATSADDVRVDVRADDITVAGNRAMTLGLILVELVLNALRHAGFTRMAAEGGGARLTVACRRIGAHSLRLTVRDNGRGLPADFDPFRGEGLGMRVVGSSVEKLEGRLNWRNEGGAVFEVTFAG